jgi:hypothetical protein
MKEEPSESARLSRERKTIEVMVRLYCRKQHGKRATLCDECGELFDYAAKRLDHCPFAVGKPACARCPVHCYKPDMRERVQAVMRFAGSRMTLRHPILAVRHLADSRRKPSAKIRSPAG